MTFLHFLRHSSDNTRSWKAVLADFIAVSVVATAVHGMHLVFTVSVGWLGLGLQFTLWNRFRRSPR